MSVNTTAALSFGADPLPPHPVTSRQKAEQASKSVAERLAALPVRCRAWADRLDLDALEAMAAVAKAYEQEGMSPVRVHVPTLSRSLKADDADTEGRLSRLIAAGAVERINRIAADPVFRPCARGSVPATKTEAFLGEVRNMVEDARAKIEGRPTPVRAKTETSTFPAGTLLGLQRRN